MKEKSSFFFLIFNIVTSMNSISNTISAKGSSNSVWMLTFRHGYIVRPHDLLQDGYGIFPDKLHSHDHIRWYKLNDILTNELHPSICKELLCLLPTELEHSQISDPEATLLNHLNDLANINILLRFYHCKGLLQVILLIKCFLSKFISIFCEFILSWVDSDSRAHKQILLCYRWVLHALKKRPFVFQIKLINQHNVKLTISRVWSEGKYEM